MSARNKIYTFRLATDKSDKYFDFIIIPAGTDTLNWETCEKEEISSIKNTDQFVDNAISLLLSIDPWIIQRIF